MQKFNYHTHTYRCGHAIGNEEEYVQKAIEAGFETIGFSEHMAYIDWDNPHDRINYHDLDEYINSMNALKEKYKDIINVRFGFEFEYFSDMKEHLLNMKEKCDYMICGQHSIDRNDSFVHLEKYSTDENVEMMTQQICEAIETGIADYIAHPDYFMYANLPYTKRKEDCIRKIAKCAKEHDVVIEINVKGTKYGTRKYPYGISYKYPNRRTYEIISEVGCKVCFGYDAHEPEFLLNRQLEDHLKELFCDLQLNYVDDLQL